MLLTRIEMKKPKVRYILSFQYFFRNTIRIAIEKILNSRILRLINRHFEIIIKISFDLFIHNYLNEPISSNNFYSNLSLHD